MSRSWEPVDAPGLEGLPLSAAVRAGDTVWVSGMISTTPEGEMVVTIWSLLALGGWQLIGRVQSVTPLAAGTTNLDSITAVVIGGTSLFGGRGSIFGTLIGALIVGVFRNGLLLPAPTCSGRNSRSGSLSSRPSPSTSGSGGWQRDAPR